MCFLHRVLDHQVLFFLNPVELLGTFSTGIILRIVSSIPSRSAILQDEAGLSKMAANHSAIQSLTNWPWISATLNAI